MKTLNENNAQIEFLTLDVVHVTLPDGDFLSTHLMRELNVLSKVKNGKAPIAYIITVSNIPDAGQALIRIHKKTERFAAGTIIALVCADRYIDLNSVNNLCQQKSVRIFDKLHSAKNWIEIKLHVTNMEQSPMNKPTQFPVNPQFTFEG